MQIFVDMDGVLADFDTGYRQTFGVFTDKKLDNVDWNLVKNTPKFFENLPPMPDFDHLWKGIEHLNPVILTGVPKTVPEAPDNKRAWVNKNIGKHVKVIACKSSEKSHHASPGDILIDDWEKYRHIWLAKGGIWITHVTAKNSLDQLKKYI